jgi:RNA polymerase sigma factor (sigma-70 family)
MSARGRRLTKDRRGCGVNEPLSFSEFFEQTFPRMLARAVMLCGHRQNAEDAVQEAYAEALRRWQKVGGYESPEAWVYMIMRQRLFAIKKGWWRRWTPTTPELLELLLPAAATAEETAEAHRVLQALALLPSRQRQVLVLHCLQGMTYQQIAEELRLSVGGVAASISKARQKLQQLLGRTLEQEGSPADQLVSGAPRVVRWPIADRADQVAATLRATESRLVECFEMDGRTLERIRLAILRRSTDTENKSR